MQKRLTHSSTSHRCSLRPNTVRGNHRTTTFLYETLSSAFMRMISQQRSEWIIHFIGRQPSKPWFEIHTDNPNYPEVTNATCYCSESVISLFSLFHRIFVHPLIQLCLFCLGGTTGLWTQIPLSHFTFNRQISVRQHTEPSETCKYTSNLLLESNTTP